MDYIMLFILGPQYHIVSPAGRVRSPAGRIPGLDDYPWHSRINSVIVRNKINSSMIAFSVFTVFDTVGWVTVAFLIGIMVYHLFRSPSCSHVLSWFTVIDYIIEFFINHSIVSFHNFKNTTASTHNIIV